MFVFPKQTTKNEYQMVDFLQPTAISLGLLPSPTPYSAVDLQKTAETGSR